MAELKTKRTGRSVDEFLHAIGDEQVRQDCLTLVKLMKRITKAEPKMWGDSIVGFGSYHYTYESGREGDWFVTGFSPRKQNLTLYLMGGLDNKSDMVKRLGEVKTARSCLYVKRLDDIDLSILEALIKWSVATIRKLEK